MFQESLSSLVKSRSNKADAIEIIAAICNGGAKITALHNCFTYVSNLRRDRSAGLADLAHGVYRESYAQKCVGGCQHELESRLVGELDNYQWG